MNLDGDVKKEFPEVNVDNESNRFRNAAAREGHDISELNNRITGDVKNERDAVSLARAALQMQQQRQQTQGSMVCWERFLHLRSLKVLLVENDHCTRHVVAALLRNCSYEVMEAANGLQAWKILEDLTNHVDLILTEVVMPCLSGISLLCKIMSHKTRKTVPVIMMSSHDSMNLVFKCLSKGATDFLVKPIRKNELKNLWQHVWRRCHSSSGSGSESGTQTQKSVKSKTVETFGNNSGSNDEDDNGSIGLNFGDGSDNGSGTQSSWIKQAVEVDSPRLTSPVAQLAQCPDSTCAQDIHSNTETLVDKWVPMNAIRKCLQQEEQLDDAVVGSLEVPGPRNLNLELKCPNEGPSQPLGTNHYSLPGIGSNKISDKIPKGQLNHNEESPSSKQEYKAANLTGVITKTTDPQADSTEFGASNKVCKILEINDIANSDTQEMPYLELSLKRHREMKDTGTTVRDDRNVLRRSDSSAFSRYTTALDANKASSRKTVNDAPLNNISEVAQNRTVHKIQSRSACNPPNQSSNEGSNNIDMGSFTDNALTKPLAIRNKSVTTPTVKTLHPSSVLQPVKDDIVCDAQQVVLDKADDLASVATLAQTRGPRLELQVQHLHHHYDQRLVHNMQQHNPPSDLDDLSLKNMAAAAPHCGSSNVLGGPVEGITANYSLNGSASGSNHGSNEMNGGSTAVPTGGTKMESDTGFAGRSGSGDASGSGSGIRADQNKFAQREAALTKFRQKRKERCFQKKVRYQNRKKLAEQRPRVRGQFVKQTTDADTSRTTES